MAGESIWSIPRLNDTDRFNIDTLAILSILSTYLGASYSNIVRIYGIIILHPISDNRMSESSVRNIEMMKRCVGSYPTLT